MIILFISALSERAHAYLRSAKVRFGLTTVRFGLTTSALDIGKL
jgi:hypothetical protein